MYALLGKWGSYDKNYIAKMRVVG